MEKVVPLEKLMVRSRRLPWILVGASLALLAVTIFLAQKQLQDRIQEQIQGRDGTMLSAVALMHARDVADLELTGGLADPSQQLLILTKTSRLNTVVVAVRLLDPRGNFVDSLPADVQPASLDPGDLSALQQLRPVSHFQARARLADLFLGPDSLTRDSENVVPLLEVNVPLHEPGKTRLLGIAQFILDGESIATEFSVLRRRLTRQAWLAFGVGGGVLCLLAAFAQSRLRQSHHALERRTRELIQANQELMLATKTTAVGAISAHLMHGLKNPLAGLYEFMAHGRAPEAERTAEDWQDALSATRRMQSMIHEALTVLGEQNAIDQFEIGFHEILGMVVGRSQPLARERGVNLIVIGDAPGVLLNHAANLVCLILVNVTENAVQATPRDNQVELGVRRNTDGSATFEIRDEGSGLPETARKTLFLPGPTEKAGGSGIGLAISRQLALHLGATLELARTSPRGCVFALTLPANLLTWKMAVAGMQR